MHRLGLGKPLGLGDVTIYGKKIETIDRKTRYTPKSLKQGHRYENFSKAPDATLVNQNALKLLVKLCVPDPNQAPVCYPFASDLGQGEYNEEEGFKWFMQNDRLRSGNGYLKKLDPDEALRPLHSSQRN
ncbi:MAG: hypothetical protein ACRESZ_03885 [Methylococcales bacterium]